MSRVIIFILDPILRDAGARQRIFGGEKGRREIIIALTDKDAQSAVFAQRLPDIGRDVQIGVGVAASDAPVPLAADAADRLIFAVGLEPQRIARPAVDRGGVARIDAIEAGVIVGLFARIVIILARVAAVEPADGQAAVAQQFLVEAAGRDAQIRLFEIGFGQAGEAGKFAADRGAFLALQLLPLEQRRGIGPDRPLARLFGELFDRRRACLAVIEGGRRHRRKVGDIAEFIARCIGPGREIEHRRDEDDAVEADIVEGYIHQLVRDRCRARGAIAFPAQEFGAVPAAIVVEPAADDFGDGLRVLRHAVIILGVGLADQVREAGARRINEDDVGHVEQRIGIVDDGVGRGAVILGIAGDRDALRPERTHHQPDGARPGPAVEQKSHRAARIARLLDIGGGDDRGFGHAILVLENRLADRRRIADLLPAERARKARRVHLRHDVLGLFRLGFFGRRVLRGKRGRNRSGKRQRDQRQTRFHRYSPRLRSGR